MWALKRDGCPSLDFVPDRVEAFPEGNKRRRKRGEILRRSRARREAVAVFPSVYGAPVSIFYSGIVSTLFPAACSQQGIPSNEGGNLQRNDSQWSEMRRWSLHADVRGAVVVWPASDWKTSDFVVLANQRDNKSQPAIQNWPMLTTIRTGHPLPPSQAFSSS
ncbi:hypothetical protein JRQ81_008858 [Phrynocephalus forsythii]|uniref:Uncharacterized protein n=1 Tax=Phrynocephalus forsythii TaxID=171643 RepID=A0A9Q0XAZ6_9SAUR|nr:hypothetical protein JRQ81_008858 [Phrynocephalus forsythii]